MSEETVKKEQGIMEEQLMQLVKEIAMKYGQGQDEKNSTATEQGQEEKKSPATEQGQEEKKSPATVQGQEENSPATEQGQEEKNSPATDQRQDEEMDTVPVQGHDEEMSAVREQGEDAEMNTVPEQGQGQEQMAIVPEQAMEQEMVIVPEEGHEEEMATVPAQGQEEMAIVPEQGHEEQTATATEPQNVQGGAAIESSEAMDTTDQEAINVEKTKKTQPAIRARCTMRKSLIRRICRIPKKGQAETRFVAEVIYTNSQFGRLAKPCSCSGLHCCGLTPNRLSKHKSLPDQRKQVGNKKSLRVSLKAKNRIHPAGKRRILCTEVDNQIFHLVELPLTCPDVPSALKYLRKAITKPRLAIKRKTGNRPVPN